MGNNVSLLKYALLIVLFCTSCVKEKDLYEPSGKILMIRKNWIYHLNSL